MRKTILHQVIGVTVSVLVLFSSLTLTFEHHICQSESCDIKTPQSSCCKSKDIVYSNPDFSFADSCCRNSSECCEDKDCCFTVSTTVIGISVVQTGIEPITITKHLFPSVLSSPFFSFTHSLPLLHKWRVDIEPPPNWCKDITVLFQVFRI